ncbi:hypothetical protein KC19_2G151800, partial [Ceratodon purpureus]
MNVCLEFHVGSRPPSVVEGGVVFHGELVPPEVVHATANGLILPPKHLNFTFFKSRAEMIVTSTCIRFAIAFLMVTRNSPRSFSDGPLQLAHGTHEDSGKNNTNP